MEEEIIIPEEEVFNYASLRYILDKNGYVCHASLGGLIICDLGECTEYKGEIPDGYETIEEWHDKEVERLNAWKIVDGNLVFDESRDYKLKILYEQQSNENSHVTRKELGISSTEEINPYTDLYPSNKSSGGYVVTVDETFNKVGNLPTEEVNLSLMEEQDLDFIELEFIGNNFLPNTAISSVNNGISYTQNKDKTINVKGTATDKSTLNLAGTDTSVRNILTFKEGIDVYNSEGEIVKLPTNYVLFGLVDGVSLEFYKYDGTDRTLVGTYKNNDVITYEEDTNVTQVVLVVDSGVTIDTTIKPMLSLVSSEYPILPMSKYKGNLLDFSSKVDTTSNGVDVKYNEDGTITLNGTATTLSYLNFPHFILEDEVYSIGIKNAHEGIRLVVRLSSQNVAITTQTRGKAEKENIYISGYSGQNAFMFAEIQEGSTFNNFTIFPMIVKNNTLGEYRKYNGRDGQYYVDGVSTQETRSGKNLFDKNNVTSGYRLGSSGNAYAESGYWLSDYIEVKSSSNYVYSRTIGTGTGSQCYCFYDSSKNFITRTYIKNNATEVKITTTSDTKYIRITDYIEIIDNIQLEEGSTATEYEEYGVSPSPDYPSEIINIYKAGTYNVVANNKVFEFTLSEDLRGLPNGIGDRLWFDIDGDNGIDIEKKVGNMILNGSENWYEYEDEEHTFALYLSEVININNKGYCNYFQTIPKNQFGIENGIYDTYTIVLIVSHLESNSVDEFKTWLSTHNTEVQYELETSTTSYIKEYSYSNYEYEEYKNNTTLIDLAGNEFTTDDEITIKDNQIILVKNDYYRVDDKTGEEIYMGEETFLGDVVMPRTYTPYTNAYSHQRVFIDFKYKDPRNIDITKINLKGLILTTDVETEYNFCSEDLTKVQNYIMGTGELTNEELDVYDINGDGVITSYDYVLISGMINGTISNKVTGTLEINSTQSKRTIVLKDTNGKILTSLGMNGISTPSLSVNGVLVEENIKTEETPTTKLLNGKRVYKRLFTGTMPTTSGTNSSLVNLDFEFDEAWIEQSLSYLTKDTETIPTTFYYSAGDYLRTWVNKDTASGTPHIRIRTGKDYSEYKYNIVVAYTKDEGGETEDTETPSEDIVEVNKTSTITGSTSSSNWTFKTVATEESIDTINKTSTVTITNYIGRPSSNSSSYFMGTLTNNYKCGDQTYSETVYKNSGTINAGGWYKLGSKTFTITHTTEPMKISVGGSMSTSAFNPNSASASGSITLTEI